MSSAATAERLGGKTGLILGYSPSHLDRSRRLTSDDEFRRSLLVVAGLGALSYAGFIVMGQVGIESEPSPIFAYPTKVTFAPNIGILLCLCGCLAAGVGAVKLLKSIQAEPRQVRPWPSHRM